MGADLVDGVQPCALPIYCPQTMVLGGRLSGGRPLPRRREMVSVYGRQRLRGTAALQIATDHRCHQRMVIAGRLLEGVRSPGAPELWPITGRDGGARARRLPALSPTVSPIASRMLS